MTNLRHITTDMESTRPDRLDTFLGLGIIWFLWFANIYDMGGGFGIKYVSYAVALLYAVHKLRPLPADRPTTHMFLCVFLLWPVLSLFHGLLVGADTALAVSQITPFIAAFVYLLASQSVSPGHAISAFFGTMFSLAVVVLAMYGLLWFNLPAGEYLLSIFQSAEHGYFGYRPFGDIDLPNVYFKATLFFVPAYVYFLCKGKLLKALLVLLALVLAFSKAGFVICLVFTLGYLFMYRTGKRRKAAIVFALLVLTPLFLGFQQFTEELVQSISGQSETSRVRLSYLGSLYDLLGESPLTLLVGQGAGVSFYSHFLGEYVTNIEVDFLNSIRKFGLPWFLVFAASVLALCTKLFRSALPDGRTLGLALLASFFATGSNPVLLSPPSLMFMMMLLDYYWRRDEFAR